MKQLRQTLRNFALWYIFVLKFRTIFVTVNNIPLKNSLHLNTFFHFIKITNTKIKGWRKRGKRWNTFHVLSLPGKRNRNYIYWENANNAKNGNLDKKAKEGSMIISSTFYTQLFLYESVLVSFSLVMLLLGFVIIWRKNIGTKAARKMLLKYTIHVNFINILRTPFAPIFLRLKITKPILTREKLLNFLLYKKCTHKMLMKYTIGW
jgi:hypothetical protein